MIRRLAILLMSAALLAFSSCEKSELELCNNRLEILRASGPYASDSEEYAIRIIHNEERAAEIRDYFHLDELYAADADTWTKAIAIGKFVATNIPHDNQKKYPEHVNAIGLWEYTQTVAPAFNCRLHSILSFELFLAAGIDAKYVTCMPKDENDDDCHVVNEVWLPELKKWAMVDTDMDGHYITDQSGTPLSLREMREFYISGNTMVLHPKFEEEGSSEKSWYYSYMAKNSYWYSCWGELSFFQEDNGHPEVLRNHYVNLLPLGFSLSAPESTYTYTTDADRFWAAPLN